MWVPKRSFHKLSYCRMLHLIPAPPQTGVLDIHGRPRKRTWTFVNQTALAGTDLISTSEDVDYQPGERLVLTPSGYVPGDMQTWSFLGIRRHMNPNANALVDRYDPWEAEEVEVAALLTPRTIKLKAPLQYDHESRMVRRAGRLVDLRVQVSDN
jgi:hypothetical protein